MKSEITNLREELTELQLEAQFMQKIECSEQETEKYLELVKKGQALPKGVFVTKRTIVDCVAAEGCLTNIPGSVKEELTFYTIQKTNLNDEEKMEYTNLKQLHYLSKLEQMEDISTIKNCVVFFTVLTVISMISSLIALFMSL